MIADAFSIRLKSGLVTSRGTAITILGSRKSDALFTVRSAPIVLVGEFIVTAMTCITKRKHILLQFTDVLLLIQCPINSHQRSASTGREASPYTKRNETRFKLRENVPSFVTGTFTSPNSYIVLQWAQNKRCFITECDFLPSLNCP